MTKKWSSTRSDLTQTKRAASKQQRRQERETERQAEETASTLMRECGDERDYF